MAKSPRPVEILFIDDVADTANLFGALFGMAGYATRICLSAAEGLDLAMRVQPLVVCSDIEMPHMNGLEFARVLRATAAINQPYLVAISGSDEPELVEQAFEAGFDICFRKPVAFQVLLHHIEQHLQSLAEG